MADKIKDWSLGCKISSAIGSMVSIKSICLLFAASFEELGEKFTLQVLSITAKQSRGVSPEFLEKIWSISHQQVADAAECNSWCNIQSADGMLSHHF